PSGCDPCRSALESGGVAAQLAIMGHGVERASLVEGCAIGGLAAVVPVVHDKTPRRRPLSGSLPHPQSLTTAERRREISAVGGHGNVEDHFAQRTESGDQGACSGLENVDKM